MSGRFGGRANDKTGARDATPPTAAEKKAATGVQRAQGYPNYVVVYSKEGRDHDIRVRADSASEAKQIAAVRAKALGLIECGFKMTSVNGKEGTIRGYGSWKNPYDQ